MDLNSVVWLILGVIVETPKWLVDQMMKYHTFTVIPSLG